MNRARVLAETVVPLAERRRAIEAEPLPHGLWALVETAAADTPDGIVLDFFEDGERLTFAELRDRAARLADGLAQAGVGHGTHVAVMLPNRSAFPVTWLALARLGAVMVPMNHAYTPREIAYIVADGRVEWVVVDRDLLGTFDPLPAGLAPDRIVVVGDAPPGARSWDALVASGRPDGMPVRTPEPDDLLNIQYTSGTTGMPKGCMLTQRYWLTTGLVNARRDGRVYRRILASTPFFYMDPQWLLVMALWQRATLFVARRQSASRFMGWVREHRIQFTLMPAVVAKQPPDPRDRDHELIRVNVYGMPRDEHRPFEERFDVIAREAYGMTEIGSGMFMPIEATDMVGSGSCGMPSPFREARIVDEAGHALPPGGVGELQIRGPGTLAGYYNKPEATADAIRDGWFRTGDLFRQDERGYFFIVGRIKDMIRRAGENIAAREVESVLTGLDAVQEAAAVPVPDPVRGEEVLAYVVLQPGSSPDTVPPARILEHCRANLAPFKVPRYLAYRDAFPKTPSDKIAKRLLAAPDADPRAGSWDRVEQRWR